MGSNTGTISIINRTKFNIAMYRQHSYQMNTWNYLQTAIAPGRSWTGQIGFETGGFMMDQNNDGGEMYFAIQDTVNSVDYLFQLQARACGGDFWVNIVNENFPMMESLNTSKPATSLPVGAATRTNWQNQNIIAYTIGGDPVSGFTLEASVTLPQAW